MNDYIDERLDDNGGELLDTSEFILFFVVLVICCGLAYLLYELATSPIWWIL